MARAVSAPDPLAGLSDIVALSPHRMIAEGVERKVFRHPDDPVRLIKIVKHKSRADYPRWTMNNLIRRFVRKARWRSTITQYQEFHRLMLDQLFDPPQRLPIAYLYGFVQTDLGLGCISELVTTAEGAPAPTLREMLDDRCLDDDHLDMLNALIARFYDERICLNDPSAENFVFGYRHVGPVGARSGPEWVLVDGFGCRHAVSLQPIVRIAHRIMLDQAFARRPIAGLQWMAEKRCFQRVDHAHKRQEAQPMPIARAGLMRADQKRGDVASLRIE